MHTTSRLTLDVPDGTDLESAFPSVSSNQMGTLDNAVLVTENTISSRPLPGAVEKDHLFRATDLDQWSITDGASWFTLLTLGAPFLTPVASSAASITAAAGQAIVAFASTAQTIDLPPSPAAGSVVAVTALNASGSAPKTIAASGSNAINGVGLSTVASFLLGTSGASVMLMWDGGHWEVVAGQQDTGWQPLSLSANIASGGYGASARLVGDRVWLKGYLQNNTGSTDSGTVATIPSGMRPSATLALGLVVNVGGGSIEWTINTSGALSCPTGFAGGGYVYLDDHSYTLS